MASAAAAHQVQHRDREAAVPATESDSHDILLGKTEIAVDFAHHVHHHLVGGMAPVHAAIQFTHRDGANALSGVVHLGVVGFQPRLELEAVEPTFHLIGQHVGDRSNSEKRVDGAGGRTTCGDAQYGFALFLQLFENCHLSSVVCSFVWIVMPLALSRRREARLIETIVAPRPKPVLAQELRRPLSGLPARSGTPAGVPENARCVADAGCSTC